MRIAYGVHGYGQGHATRCLAVLPELRKRHDVLVLAGGDAYDVIHREHPAVAVPAVRYHYTAGGRRSTLLTLSRTAPLSLDVLSRGPSFRMVESVLREFDPDAIVSDAEIWAHWVGRHMGIPRVSFDHFGIMAYFNPPMRRVDRLRKSRDVWVYKALTRQPERIIVSSFYDAPPARPGVRLVGPLLRREVAEVSPTAGDHLLVYVNNGRHLLTPRMEQALAEVGCPVWIYGTPRLGKEGPLEFRPRGNRTFLEALASCRAVISTAGNQLVGEAIHFRKPMLVMPEDCVEQRINGLAVERLGIGRQVPMNDLTAGGIRGFLDEAPSLRSAMEGCARDGLREAIEALEASVAELAGSGSREQSRRCVA